MADPGPRAPRPIDRASAPRARGGLPRRLRAIGGRWPWLLPTLLAALLRTWGLGDRPFGMDEGSSLWYAGFEPATLWQRLPVEQQHPPFYYLALKGWLLGGDSEAHVRLLSALLSIATVPVGWALARAVVGRRAACWAAWLLTAAPFAVAQGRVARMYSLLGLEAAVAWWACARILQGARSPGPWIAFALACAALPWTHDAGVLVLVAANVAWRLSPGRVSARAWLTLQAVVLAAWAPWAPGWLAQAEAVRQRYWIPPTTAAWVATGVLQWAGAWDYHGLASSPRDGVEAAAAAGAGAVIAAVLYGLRVAWRDRTRLALLSAGVLVAPALLLAASLVRPLFLARAFAWTLVPACAAAGLGLARCRPPVRAAWALAIALGHAASLSAPWRDPVLEPWDLAARHVAERCMDDDAIVFVSPLGQAVFDRYFRDCAKKPMEYGAPSSLAESGAREPPVTAESTAALEPRLARHPRVWLVWSAAARYNDPERRTETMLLRDRRRESWYEAGWLRVSLYSRPR